MRTDQENRRRPFDRRFSDSAASSPRLLRAGVVRKFSCVVGELLVTAGMVLLLFVGWELWWTNIAANAEQSELVELLVEDFGGPVDPQPPLATEMNYGEPPMIADVTYGQPIGVMYIPRFAPDYARPVVSGVGPDILDHLGLGHYTGTAMPGQVGNFAVAGHRQTHGQVLDQIHTLVPGDRIFVQTADGYFTYVYRNSQIVLPARADVLLPVPTEPATQATERILTMTSCNPRFGAEERIIAYSVMESWRPLASGPPAEIAEQVAAAAQRVA